MNAALEEENAELLAALTQLCEAEDASCDKFEAEEIDAIEAPAKLLPNQ